MGLALGLVSVFLMSTGPVINKFILQSTGAAFAALSSSIVSFAVFSFWQLIKTRRFNLEFDRWNVTAGFLNGGGLIFLFLSLKYVHPVIVGVIGRVGIVVAMILSSLFLRQHPDRTEMALGGFAIAGAFGAGFRDLGSAQVRGLSFCLLSTLCFVSSHLFLKRASTQGDSLQTLAVTNFISVCLLLLLYLMEPQGGAIPKDNRTWTLIVTSALFSSCLGFWCYVESLKYLTLARANLLRATGPFFTAAAAFPFFGLTFNKVQAFSALSLLASVLTLTWYEQRKLSAPTKHTSLKSTRSEFPRTPCLCDPQSQTPPEHKEEEDSDLMWEH